ncbi:hypothetical protein LZ023_17050 [Pseudomonas silvicola]|nr:hypothetical protein LZ023_17050 [Pseudomonas silvicola]
MQGTVLWVALFTCLAGLCSSFWELLPVRFLQGIGYGGEAAVGFASTEMGLPTAMGVFAITSYLIAFIAALRLPDATGAEMTEERPNRGQTDKIAQVVHHH